MPGHGIFHNRATAWRVGVLAAWMCMWALPLLAQVQPPDSVTDNRTTRPRIQPKDADPFYVKDSTELAADSIRAVEDSLQRAQLQTRTDSLRENSPLKATLAYKAADSLTLNLRGRRMKLYEEAEVDYGSSKIRAARVEVDWEMTLMYAEGVPIDSTGEAFRGEPEFEDNGQTYYNHRVIYNYQTQRGKVIGTQTTQEENVFRALETKRTPDGSFYAKDGIFTTCQADHPHFHLRAKKLKVIPGDRFISGPVFLSLNDVPLPIGLPFGFFPQRDKRSSGILFPLVGEDANRGFNLRNFGYYLVLSEHVDVAAQADYYFRGSYRLALTSNYNKLYRYNGRFSINVARNISNERGDLNYAEDNSFQVRWDHFQPINPTTQLTASVNYASSTYLQNNAFEIGGGTADGGVFNNSVQSSVNFSKNFPRARWNVSAALTHNSELQSGQVTLTLPRVNWARQRFFPFKSLGKVGANQWYDQIGVTYSGNLVNQISVLEQNLFQSAGNDSFRFGINHRVGVNTNFRLLNYITVTPSITYNEYWYLEERQYSRFLVNTVFDEPFRPSANADTSYFGFATDSVGVAGTRIPGFASTRDFAFNVSFTTSVYGIWAPKGNARRRAFRHTLRPSINYTYRPDFSEPFWGVYTPVAIDSAGTQFQRFSKFQGFVVGGPSAGESQSLTFTLDNVLETKALEKQDTTDRRRESGEPQYVYTTLVDNLGASLSYNFAADSFQLSAVTLVARSNFLDNKISVLSGAVLNPYQVSPNGQRIVNEFMWEGSSGLVRLTDFNLAVTFALRSKQGERSGGALTPQEASLLKQTPESQGLSPELLDLERYRLLYADFNVPWSFNANYSFRYSKPRTDAATTTQTLNFGGDVRLTNKWRFGVTSGYDLDNGGVTFTSLSVSRELHCWDLQFSAVPFGLRQYYSLVIAVKSSALQDLKVTKRRDWRDGFVGR